jgi:SSU ribosomal protein S7P
MATEQPDPDAPVDEDTSARLFGQWSVDDIEYGDVSTERYVTVTPVAHTMGRHANNSSRKARSASSSGSSTV